uniref:Uncharacterized protein AlNc14C21G2132 n=1 Tax=Albugo laibachii Nc14 TaxID=890382 RepID=F0W5G6_9STRA|nr:conserved hypothetical protein [Albugo laibachii Nc14]|eukprot:CCA16357.1 conserved hypothetical protein [Albugo laibachii Nc14]
MDPYDYDLRSNKHTSSIATYKGTADSSSECLHATWSSALCVNSLYDAYSQAQADNESLRKTTTLLQQEIDALRQKVLDAKQCSQPEAKSPSPKSKYQHAGTHLRDKCDDLQSQLVEYKRLYSQQVAKYDAKFAINPLEEQRVSVSLRTMQTTLDKTQREKDELLSQYQAIRDYNKVLDIQQLECRKTIAALEEKRLQSKGRVLLAAVRSLTKRLLINAWSRWKVSNDYWEAKQRLHDKEKRFQEHIKQFLISKAHNQHLNECFRAWRAYCVMKIRHRRTFDTLLKKKSRSVQIGHFSAWKSVILVRKKQRLRLKALLSRKQNRYKLKAVQNWQVYLLYQVRASLITQQSFTSTLQKDLERIQNTAQIVEAESSALEAERTNEWQLQQNEYQAASNRNCILIRRLAECFHAKKRFKKIRGVFSAWYQLAKTTLRIRRNTEQLMQRRTTAHVRDAVAYWHRFVGFQATFTSYIHKMDQKRRNTQIITCFTSWRRRNISERRHKRLARLLVSYSHQQIFERSWSTWRASLRQRQLKLVAINCSLQRLTKNSQYRSFIRWKRFVSCQRDKKHIEESQKYCLAKAGQDTGRLHDSFLSWKRKMQASRLLSRFQTHQHTRNRFRILRNLWHGWQKYIKTNQSQKTLLRRALTHVYYMNMQVSWNRFSRQIQLQRLMMIQKSHEEELLAKDKQLQGITESSSAQIACLQNHMVGAVSNLHSVQHRQNMLQEVVFFLGRRHQKFKRLRVAYSKWSTWVVNQKEGQKLFTARQKILLDTRIKRCIAGWRGLSKLSRNRHLRISQIIAHVFSMLVFCLVFQKWKQRARQSQFTRLHAQKTMGQSRSRCWTRWKDHTRNCLLTRFFQHCSSRILQNGLTRWNEIIIQEKWLERLRERDEHCESLRLGILHRQQIELFSKTFQQWRTSAQLHQKQREILRRMVEKRGRGILLQTFLKWIRSGHATLWLKSFCKRYFICRWKTMGFKHWHQVIVRIKHQEWVERSIDAQNLTLKVDQKDQMIHQMQLQSQKAEELALIVQRIQQARHFDGLQQSILWRWHSLARDESKCDQFRVMQHIRSKMQKYLFVLFASWKARWSTSRKLQRFLTVLEKRRRQAASLYLQRWKQRGKLHRLARGAKQSIHRKRMKTGLRRWITASNQEKKDLQYRLIYWERERSNRKKRRFLFCWKETLCNKRSLLEKCFQFQILKHHQSSKRLAFNAWKQVISVKKSRYKQLQVHLLQRQQNLVNNSWKMWHSRTIQSRERCMQLRHIFGIQILRNVLSAFNKWRNEVYCAHKTHWISKNTELLISKERSHEQIEEAKKAIQLMHPQLLKQAQCLQDMKSEKHQMKQEAEAKWRKIQMKYHACRRYACVCNVRLAWNSLKYHVIRSKQARIQFNRTYRQRRRRMIKQTWVSWKTYTRTFKAIARKIHQHSLQIKKSAWKEWGRWHFQRHRCQQILSHFVLRNLERYEKRLESFLLIWKTNTRAIAEVARLREANIGVYEQLTLKARHMRFLALWNVCQRRDVRSTLRLFLWKWHFLSHKCLGVSKAPENPSICETQVSFQTLRNVRSMIQRLSHSLKMEEFFDAVRLSISQCIPRGAGILLLLDPCRQQLWHIHAKRTIQIPSAFGIAGMAVASLEPIFVQDVTKDSRYHPLVDQYALSGLGHIESRESFHDHGGVLSMLALSLQASDGSIYGVLQIVYPFTSAPTHTTKVHTDTEYEARVCGRICVSYVESVLEDLLRDVGDRIRARQPEQLVKLYQMQKRWPKHYLSMEKKSREIERKYEALKKQQHRQEQVIEKNIAPHAQLKEHNAKLDKVLETLYTKIKSLKEKLHEQQTILQSKDKQLRSLQASREKMVHVSSRSQEDLEEKWEHRSRILHAEILNLRNQLVRTEADNLLLVKAVSILLSQNELPQSLENEVQRITQRFD